VSYGQLIDDLYVIVQALRADQSDEFVKAAQVELRRLSEKTITGTT